MYLRFQAAVFVTLTVISTAQESGARPNILIIMADDMGFDDISFRGSDHFLTPNIDALAYSGVILKNLYVPAMCSPSRAALLTGKYPINTGMQHYIIPNDQPWGLPTDEVTMAQIFQQHGYFTSLIGKWHLGMSRRAYTPTYRGFDHHFGYLGAYIDYWDYTLYSSNKNYSRGHDLRENLRVSPKQAGTYASRLFTEEAVKLIKQQKPRSTKPLFLILSHLAPHSGNEDAPLQAPAEAIAKFAYIKDEQRRTYAAMMSELDRSVGEVIAALSERGLLNNTIILFYSDNGGPTEGMHATTASNHPLRGQKNSPWEGGVRSSAALWSLAIEKLGAVCKQRMYVADLLPTLAAAAGITLDENLQLDGLNLWSALKYGYEAVEREIVHNIDDYFAYTKGKWKLLRGSTEQGAYDGWLSGRPRMEVDDRAAKYEETVRATSVWQQLNVFHATSPTNNISKLRAEAGVSCSRENHTERDGGGVPCDALSETCLFDIEADPCEQQNLYAQHKESTFVREMLARIQYFRERARPPNNRPTDPLCDPKYYHFEWTWWEDERNSANPAAESTCPKVFWRHFLRFPF